MTEVQNAEIENTEVATEENTTPDNANEENTTVESTPEIVKIPTSVEEAKELFPLTAAETTSLPFGILSQLIEKVGVAKDITNELAANNQDLSTDDIITLASQRSEDAIKVLYASYEKMRLALEKKAKDIVDSMDPLLSEGKLSEEEVAGKIVERKAVIEGIQNFKGSIDMFPHLIPEAEREMFLKVVSEMKAPGMRGSGSVKTSSASASGYGKPRLHGGKVQVKFGDNEKLSEFASLPDAAKVIASQTNSPVSGPDLLQAWCLSQSVSHWSDVPMGITEFQLQPGVYIYVEKKADPKAA